MNVYNCMWYNSFGKKKSCVEGRGITVINLLGYSPIWHASNVHIRICGKLAEDKLFASGRSRLQHSIYG